MNLRVANITHRIEELDIEIAKLEERLAAKHWERSKYLEFSANNDTQLEDPSVK